MKTVTDLQTAVLICNPEGNEECYVQINNDGDNFCSEKLGIIDVNHSFKGESATSSTSSNESLEIGEIDDEDDGDEEINKIKPHYRTEKKLKKEYECDLCDKKFSFRHNLIRHKEIHEGKKYKCPLCDKGK